MSAIDLTALGFTQDELRERVIDRLCDRLLADGDFEDSEFAGKLNQTIQKRIDHAINRLAEKHVLPNVTQYVESLTLQATNKWGEAKGKPVSFVEYLVERADAYLREEVDYEGQSKAEKRDAYNWRKAQTRVMHLVHQHLHYAVESAMKQALEAANSSIVEGLHEAVKIKLSSFASDLKVTLAVKEKR
jgi:hypothetical protein